jgi:acetylornithine aminotransferase
MEQENLVEHANEIGTYLINELKKTDAIKNVRGTGLMIGFDVPEEIKTLRKDLLSHHHIFTGEAKPNVIRLLPALSVSKAHTDEFLKALKEAIHTLTNKQEAPIEAKA